MKKLIVLLFLISTVSLSQTRDIVPRADGEGYIGTMGKHWLGANLDSLNGIAIGTYISQKDSATKYLPFWWNGKFYLKSDTNSATLGFYPRQQIDALIASLSGGGIASLNGLSGASQTFAIDTTVSGVPAFSSATTVHTLQLPFARFLRQSDTTASVAMQWELDGKLGLGLARLTGDSSAIAGTAGKYISPTMVAASYAPIASPTFTGTVTLPTGLTGTVRVASGVVSATASDTIGLGVNLYGKVNVSDTSATPSGRGKVVTPSMLALKAPLASPTFTGTVTAPTIDSSQVRKLKIGANGIVIDSSKTVGNYKAFYSNGTVYYAKNDTAAAGGSSSTTSFVRTTNFTTTSGSYVDVTNMVFAATANTKYVVQIGVSFDGNVSRLQISSPTSALISGTYVRAEDALFKYIALAGRTTNQVELLVAMATDNLSATLLIEVGANSGNISLQAYAAAGTATLYKGSIMTVTTSQ